MCPVWVGALEAKTPRQISLPRRLTEPELLRYGGLAIPTKGSMPSLLEAVNPLVSSPPEAR